MADTDHRAALRQLLASGVLSVVPAASIEALCEEVAKLRAELAAARATPGDSDLAELIEATSYQLAPYQWTAEHMDEQHWIGVQAVMPRIDELLDRCTAAEAGHASAASSLVEARAELAAAKADAARWQRVKPLLIELREAWTSTSQTNPAIAALLAAAQAEDRQ